MQQWMRFDETDQQETLNVTVTWLEHDTKSIKSALLACPAPMLLPKSFRGLTRICLKGRSREFRDEAGTPYKVARHHAIGRLGCFKWDLDLGIPV